MSQREMKERLARAEANGLYRAEHEHDACGVGFVARTGGEASHALVRDALVLLGHMTHRGAAGSDPLTGDGAGILTQIPHALFAREAASRGVTLPKPGNYGVAMLFLPNESSVVRALRDRTERLALAEGCEPLFWREVPIDPTQCGPIARGTLPSIWQFFVTAKSFGVQDSARFEVALFRLRKRLERDARDEVAMDASPPYACSISTRTIVYKGLLVPSRLDRFYPDLADPLFESAIALVHQRFSTNTFPTWERAHPYRFLAHNGEINALRGNVGNMRAREASLASPILGEDLRDLTPIVHEGGSDSAMLDNAVELLVRAGRSLPHALTMLVPPAWEHDATLTPARRAFHDYHASLSEPWDGPASLVFTDGQVVGALLDRNGLRPSRYLVTDDGLVVLASECGVLDIGADRIVRKGRVAPGEMFLVDTVHGRIVEDAEIRETLAARRPYRTWLDEQRVSLEQLPAAEPRELIDASHLRDAWRAFGYTEEDLRMVVSPMAATGHEAIGSMGNDTPLAVLSDRPQLLYSYFKQLFAQVTNPPIDPLRETLVTSVRVLLGPERNLLDETPQHANQLVLDEPVLGPESFARIASLSRGELRAMTLPMHFARDGAGALRHGLDELCARAEGAVRGGASVLVLSDRDVPAGSHAIPALLATAAVHHALIRRGLRMRCSLVVDSGEPREVMHFCLLLGYGASAVHPWLACETVAARARDGWLNGIEPAKAVSQYLHAASAGIVKVMSKMGISTLQSYRGAQQFEAVGLARDVVDRYFAGTTSRIEGIDLEGLAREVAERDRGAASAPFASGVDAPLPSGGLYQWRRDGERHQYNPDSIALLQHAVRANDVALYRKYSAAVDAENRRHGTLRGMLSFRRASPVPLSEVEPASAIVRRFKTGAMSFGSISKEAHETLAIAMNRLGGRSNSGEGGEDSARFERDANGDWRRSAIKQVASGRFGVTSHYLVNADELQIKMAQGAKPGEGGQLPGHKVDAFVARVRHSIAGVGLISPPPHHDIYSIEDLAQLIHDLRSANDRARISVKLVSEAGVGTVAAGVAKAGADVILVSGDSGGTGAAPLTSIKHAGTPWEIGLAESHQVLVLNDLRTRVRLETDGQLKTGRDVAVACLLGAEEFGFATAALVASGCVMMRVCHLNTCPVGVATQDPELRKRYEGKPEHVIAMMTFIAEELREIMASLGFRTIDEMVGRTDMLEPDESAASHWKSTRVQLSQLLFQPEQVGTMRLHGPASIAPHASSALEAMLHTRAHAAIEHGTPVRIEVPVRNVDRAIGTRLSAAISRKHGAAGLPDDTITIACEGTAGQSLGAFLARGVTLSLIGEANDYVGKGLSGGRIIVQPPATARFVAEDNSILGNTVLYGATSGELFARGRAGERFAVRNSGATAVIEGVGDHGCEYMTRGVVVCLGPTGRNFAAGMSGGVAYVIDSNGTFARRCNMDMVDLEPVDEEDRTTLRALLHRHYEYTGSTVAWRMLSGWKAWADRFVKVMPRDYRRVLDAERHARDAAASG